jgi:hypothetical protein
MQAVAPDWLKRPLIRLLDLREEEDVFKAYYRLNNSSSIEKCAEAAGFRVVEIKTVCSPPITSVLGPLAAIELLIIRLLGWEALGVSAAELDRGAGARKLSAGTATPARRQHPHCRPPPPEAILGLAASLPRVFSVCSQRRPRPNSVGVNKLSNPTTGPWTNVEKVDSGLCRTGFCPF